MEDYYYAERRVPPSDFVDTTFMYGLQIAALSLFVTWSYIYGAWSIVVPLFWAFGYLLFSVALFIAPIREAFLSSSFGTLHSFLGRTHGRHLVAVSAAMITLVALAGPAMFEPYFTAGVIAKSLGYKNSLLDLMQISCFIGFVAISAVYLVIGGFRTVVITNQWQLAVGYTAFNICVGLVLLSLSTIPTQNRYAFAVLLVLCGATLLALSAIVQMVQRRLDPLSTFSHLISTGFLALATYRLSGSDAAALAPFLGEQFGTPFPALSLISLLIANGLYQFVDVGQWQRVLSLDIRQASDDDKSQIRLIATSNLIAGLASSVSWCVAIIFGLILRTAFPEEDSYTVLSSVLNRLAPFDYPWIAFLFVVALISIMFSTLDALCSAVSFTVQYDILGGKNVTFARLLTITLLVFYIFYYLLLKQLTGDKLDAILYASWSLQIGLLPGVVAALFARRSFVPTVCSLGGGFIGATILLFLGLPDKVFELAPVLALTVSLLGFIIGAVSVKILERIKLFANLKRRLK